MTSPEPPKPSLVLRARVRAKGIFLRAVRCNVYLPENRSGSITIHLFPTPRQHNHLHVMSTFSLHGSVKDLAGGKTAISAARVHMTKHLTSRRGIGIEERVVTARPEALKITQWMPPGKSLKAKGTHVVLWISPSALLAPAQIVGLAESGEVSVKTVRQLMVPLKHGYSLVW